MSDPTQNPRPDENENPPPPSYGDQGAAPPPAPPPSEEQGSYGTQPPPGGWSRPGPTPPSGGWQQSGGIGQPADLMPRFVARLIDLVLAWVVILLVNALLIGLFLGASRVGSGDLGSGTTYAIGAVVSILGAALLFGYFTLMEATRGQTVGKMLMRLETRGPDGGRPTMQQAAKRNAFTAVGVLGAVPILSFLTVPLFLAAVVTIAVTITNNKTTRRGWHDDFAGGTTVVRIG